MKNKLLILLLGFGLTGFANVLPSAPVTDLRDWNQYRRIERGVNMGLLSYREEGILLEQQENIENYIYRAMQYGITPRENRNIQNMRIEADLLIEEFSNNFEYRIQRSAVRFNYSIIPRYYTYRPYRSNPGHHHHHHSNNGYRNYNDDRNTYRDRNDNHHRNDYNSRDDKDSRRDRGYMNRDNYDKRNDREEIRENSNRNNKNNNGRNSNNRTLPKNTAVTRMRY